MAVNNNNKRYHSRCKL